MMIEFLTSDRIANAISQDSRYSGMYVIVEGKSDVKFYSLAFDSETVRLTAAHGNSNVLEVLEKLRSRGFQKKLGIIDADFGNILSSLPDFDDLFITDAHDLEVMILLTDTLERIVSFHADSERIVTFEGFRECSLREAVFQLAMKIGRLKLANKVDSLGLVFKPEKPDGPKIKYHKFIDARTLSLTSEEDLIRTAIEYSTNRGTKVKTSSEILDSLERIREIKYPAEQICNGHDLVEILYFLLTKILKAPPKSVSSSQVVHDAIMLNYSLSDFSATKLGRLLAEWEQSTGFRLFKQVSTA